MGFGGRPLSRKLFLPFVDKRRRDDDLTSLLPCVTLLSLTSRRHCRQTRDSLFLTLFLEIRLRRDDDHGLQDEELSLLIAAAAVLAGYWHCWPSQGGSLNPRTSRENLDNSHKRQN